MLGHQTCAGPAPRAPGWKGDAVTAITRFMKRLQDLKALDPVAKPLIDLAGRLVQPRPVRNTLSGTNLGHPLHPLLTDVPIGAFTMSAVLDTVGGRRCRPAADLLVGAGIVAAVPTALTGVNDWSDTYGPETRLGLVHAAANSAALMVYGSSLAARMRGRRGLGLALGYAGFATMLAGAYAGGHLSFVMGINVNHTAFEHRPDDWTPVLADADLADGAPTKVSADGADVLLYRYGGVLYALANTCTHMGGPLNEGRFADGCVTCPWHGSTFRLRDGHIVRGPASTPEPAYETRIRDGQIEVRATS